MSELGGWCHLVRRFLEVLTARPLNEQQREEASVLLRSDAEERVFFGQPAADQQHGLAAARLVAGRVELRRAALLHDIGKQEARLGVWGRSLASALARFHVTVRGRLQTYLDHGPIGAGILQKLGAESIVVDFARHHQGVRPPTITPDDWDTLRNADRKARTLFSRAIR
ncbi:MAG: HDIG domain-containing protein [Gammaproteobacteria bacterium]|nr:HDIG domain-containing protein [Gammaproteobacteria bacterium]